MSLKYPNNYNPIKIIILDLYPTYSELNPSDEELLIIFEGLNIFFNLKDLLTSHKKIEINNINQSSIIVSLIKTNNIIASGYINLKHGEQWITMNSENKKKSNMNLALVLIDCIKLKIFCEMKNINKTSISTNVSNANNSSLNLTNINNSINLTNRNINKPNQNINQLNLKISKKNTNSKKFLKCSPKKINLDIYESRRSPKVNISDYRNIKYSTNTNNYSNSNYNSINHQNYNKGNNSPYTTISKQSIKKIDLNSSSKTRNSKLEKKSPLKSNYTSLRISNNFEIKKMKTSVNNLNKKYGKSRITPDIEIKELHNAKHLGGSPKLYHKNRLDEDIYQNIGNSGDRTFHYGKKNIKNINLEKNYLSNNFINNVEPKKTKRKMDKKNYSNNILNINYENNNNIINMNIVNNINNPGKAINSNNYTNFNNTFGNNFNKQDLKNKLLYQSNPNQIIVNQAYDYFNDNNLNLNKNKKTDFERSLNSLEEEGDKNINKVNNNLKIQEKKVVYTNKRMNIKKNKTQINKKNLDKKINSEKVLIQKIEENIPHQENNENNNYSKNIIKLEDNNETKEENNNKENIISNDIDMNENNENEYNNFERIKEDFLLLYSENYMDNIQEDLIKLEIELFFEKMIELIQSYHNEYDQKKLEKEIIQNDLNLNCFKYKMIHKLIKKFENTKINYEINNKNKIVNDNKKNNDLYINKSEIEIFKYFFEKKDGFNDRKNVLKNIFNTIIKNNDINNINNIVDNDKLQKLVGRKLLKNIENYIPDNNYYQKNFSISPIYQKNTNIKYIKDSNKQK